MSYNESLIKTNIFEQMISENKMSLNRKYVGILTILRSRKPLGDTDSLFESNNEHS